MKCYGSPTTSTVPSPSSPRRTESAASDAFARALRQRAEVVANVEAIVMREAFAPLAKAMGFYGDLVVTATIGGLARTQAVARDAS